MRKFNYQYISVTDRVDRLYIIAARYLEQTLLQIGNGQKTAEREPELKLDDQRIRVAFSVDVLAYFFKLLHKVGALDSGPVSQLLLSVSKTFVTVGLGQNYISVGSLNTKYRQVVQSSARSLRTLLVKMLKQLDDEFAVF